MNREDASVIAHQIRLVINPKAADGRILHTEQNTGQIHLARDFLTFFVFCTTSGQTVRIDKDKFLFRQMADQKVQHIITRRTFIPVPECSNICEPVRLFVKDKMEFHKTPFRKG